MSNIPRNSAAFKTQEITRIRNENDTLQSEVQSLRKFVESLGILYDASDNFKDDSELLPFLKTTLYNALKLLNAPDGSLALLDDETDELVFVIVVGALEDELTEFRIPKDEGIAGWVIKNRKPALVRDVRRDPRFYSGVDESFTFKTQSIAAAPMIGGGKIYGLIEVLNQPGDEPFSDKDVSLLKLMCRAAGDALANIDRMPQSE